MIESGEVLTLLDVVYETATQVGAMRPVVKDVLVAESPLVNPEYVLA